MVSPPALSRQIPRLPVVALGNRLVRCLGVRVAERTAQETARRCDMRAAIFRGGDIVVDNTAAEFHCTIIAISESPVTPGVIWVGTDDGQIQVTKDNGAHWTNVIKRTQPDREGFCINLQGRYFTSSSTFRFDLRTLLALRTPPAPSCARATTPRPRCSPPSTGATSSRTPGSRSRVSDLRALPRGNVLSRFARRGVPRAGRPPRRRHR